MRESEKVRKGESEGERSRAVTFGAQVARGLEANRGGLGVPKVLHLTRPAPFHKQVAVQLRQPIPRHTASQMQPDQTNESSCVFVCECRLYFCSTNTKPQPDNTRKKSALKSKRSVCVRACVCACVFNTEKNWRQRFVSFYTDPKSSFHRTTPRTSTNRRRNEMNQ